MKSGFDTDQAFLFKIKEGGFTEASYREDIRQQRSVQRLVSEGVLASIDVSDEEIEEFYDANIDQMKMPEAIQARHILVKPGDSEEAKKAAQDKIAEAQKKLQDGADFAAIAIEYSEGPSAPQGGDLGFFGRGQMVPEFEDAAFALQTGELSDIVETPFGFHLIIVDERREERIVVVEEASERIYEFLTQGQLEATMGELVESLQATANIEGAPPS
jgi:peptidyl-prolyl cis-trans isomerase C